MRAERVWSALQGIFCVYKPVDMSLSGFKRQIVKRICADGNNVVGWSNLPNIKMPIVEPHQRTGSLIIVGEREQVDYLSHPLVVGEPFRSEDIQLEELHPIEGTSSGVCVLGINGGCSDLPSLLARSWVNEYRLEGILGRETYNHQVNARITVKANYEHITRHRLQKLLARIQSQCRRVAFESAGVDLQSEEAFEIALKGLPRAQLAGAQLIYNIDLKLFRPPYFVLGVQTVGETDHFLRCFIHEIGVELGTTACCVRLQRRSVGPFRAQHALLEKQVTLQNIIRNISMCRKILHESQTDSDVINEMNISDNEDTKDILDGLNINHHEDESDAMHPPWPRDYT